MRQINIASPVQKDCNDVNTQRCQQCAAQRDVQEQPDPQHGCQLGFATQPLQQGGLEPTTRAASVRWTGNLVVAAPVRSSANV